MQIKTGWKEYSVKLDKIVQIEYVVKQELSNTMSQSQAQPNRRWSQKSADLEENELPIVWPNRSRTDQTGETAAGEQTRGATMITKTMLAVTRNYAAVATGCAGTMTNVCSASFVRYGTTRHARELMVQHILF